MIVSAATAIYLAGSIISGAATDGRDPFEGAKEVLHFTFENDQDRDFNRQPDDWTRRKGPRFPAYVDTGIDRNRGYQSDQSLRFEVNGGMAVTYSPPILIDSLHAYVFRGYIRTQALKHDAAIISLSFLNHKRERIQRLTTPPVSGTHKDWVEVRILPIAAHPDTRFVVVGCHLVHGNKMDIRGAAWFDGLWMGRLPQLSLVSDFQSHFKSPDTEIEIESVVSGLDPERKYLLHLEMKDGAGNVIKSVTESLPREQLVPTTTEEASAPKADSAEHAGILREIVPFHGGRQPHGFYLVRATLENEGRFVVSKESTFAVMDLGGTARRDRGEFGWSIASHRGSSSITELADVASEAGINWLKFPLWSSVYSEDTDVPAEISNLLESLTQRGITPVGLLSDPPLQMRSQFASDWAGFREIFTMPPSFWSKSLDPVIARYWSKVRHWQLGDETDDSFASVKSISEILVAAKKELDRIGRDTHVGVHWDWETPIPEGRGMSQAFLSISNQEQLTPEMLATKLALSQNSAVPRWVLLKPLSKNSFSDVERGADLVKRMVAAKRGRAQAIYAWDIFDDEFGLLNADGSPTVLFLPWRTAAMALQGAQYLGSFNLPGGSQNFAFARDGEVVVVIWNNEPTVETVYLGEWAKASDIWGQELKLDRDPQTSRQIIPADDVPQFIGGCSEPLARWRLDAQFKNGVVESAHGAHPDSVLITNTFPQGVSGAVTLTVPREWEVKPPRLQFDLAPGEIAELPFTLNLPPSASLGVEQLKLEFDFVADLQYNFEVLRPYEVGLGKVTITVIDRPTEDGRLMVEQIITNNTDDGEILNFRCSLSIPGYRRLWRNVTKLGTGQDKKIYLVPNAQELKGKQILLRAEQVGGKRVLNKIITVGDIWDDLEATN